MSADDLDDIIQPLTEEEFEIIRDAILPDLKELLEWFSQ